MFHDTICFKIPDKLENKWQATNSGRCQYETNKQNQLQDKNRILGWQGQISRDWTMIKQ